MKYRIRITTFESGRQEFRAQKKVLLGWSDIGYDGELESSFSQHTPTRDKALERIDKNYSGNAKKRTIEFEYINKL